MRDSRTGYLVPVRAGPRALPDGQSCWDAAVAVAVVNWPLEIQVLIPAGELSIWSFDMVLGSW